MTDKRPRRHRWTGKRKGAPDGNSNATRTHGQRSRAFVARRKAVNTVLRSACAAVRASRAALKDG
jgi:hypothetical protein